MPKIYVDYSQAVAGPELDDAVYQEWCTRDDGSRWIGGTKRKFSTRVEDALWLMWFIQIETMCSVTYWWDRGHRTYHVVLEYDPSVDPDSEMVALQPDSWVASSEADTLPLAVCRAALQKQDPDSEEGEQANLNEFFRMAEHFPGWTDTSDIIES